MDDFMEVGSVIPLGEGWFMDVQTRRRFRYNEDGFAVFEENVTPEDYATRNDDDDEDYE